MDNLVACTDPVSLEELAGRIRKSSNFRFSWQFYQTGVIDSLSPEDVRRALDSIIATPKLHRFLQESFEVMYDDTFKIEPLHQHCQVTATNEFENVLASSAGGHSGAYSRELRSANVDEQQEIRELFGSVGSYHTYQLVPGTVPGCTTCRDYTSHLFTTWFYGVAWDWCLFAWWPKHSLLWMGCLTDTD